MYVCVWLYVPLTSATRSTPQVPQHALITINDGSTGNEAESALIMMTASPLTHLKLLQTGSTCSPSPPGPPLCRTPPPQLVAQVGQAQNLSPIIVDIVYGCQRPQPVSQSHLICRRLLQWQSTPVTQLLSLSHSLPSTYTSHSPSVPGLSLLGLHHGLTFHFLLITFSCNGTSYLDLHFNWTVIQLFNLMRKLLSHSKYYIVSYYGKYYILS